MTLARGQRGLPDSLGARKASLALGERRFGVRVRHAGAASGARWRAASPRTDVGCACRRDQSAVQAHPFHTDQPGHDQDHDDQAVGDERCRASSPALASPYARELLAGRDQAPAPAEELPGAGPSQILRFDTAAIHAVLDAKRREQGMTWSEVVREIPGFTASMLTNLANGPLIGFPRVMALPQWLGRPASDFVRAAKCADGGSERRGLERIAFRRHHPHGSRRLRGARITRWRRRAASPSGRRDPE